MLETYVEYTSSCQGRERSLERIRRLVHSTAWRNRTDRIRHSSSYTGLQPDNIGQHNDIVTCVW